jgi:hypothetical protein
VWAVKSLKSVVSANSVVAGGWVEGVVVFGAVRHAQLMDS